MDESQRLKIENSAAEIAEELKSTDFARKLRMLRLVSNEKVDEIMNRFHTDVPRNVQLLYAVQECRMESAFSDLVEVLTDLGSTKVSLLTTNSSPKSDKLKSCKQLIGMFKSTFGTRGKFPLGVTSGLPSIPSSYQSGCASQSSYPCDTTNPLKEKHQTTLISSNSSLSSKSSQQREQQQDDMTPKNFRLSRRNPDGPLAGRNNLSTSKTEHYNNGDNVNLDRPTDGSSQTSSRSCRLELDNIRESTRNFRITGLGVKDRDEPRSSEAGEEPVISWHPYAQSPTHENAPRACSPHRCYSSASSESGESSSDSLIVDPNLILDSNVMTAIAREGPNMMSVKMATVLHNDPEDYRMTSRPRGNCLIVNNINFEGEILPTRKGSDEDANRFDQIFRQLGFETIMTRNLTAEQMREKFKELSRACKPEHDALFVFILSHGSEHGIYGTDGIEVYLESEIISCFDNRNCKAMIGKPKVLVIQACRGRSKDCGGEGDTTDSIAWLPEESGEAVRSLSQENRVPNSWLPSQPSDGKKRKHPIRTDMLLVFSCLAG